jgi:hypothetical protein
LNLAPADGTNGGIVTTGAQTFAGAKTFSSDLTVNGITVGRGLNGISTNTAMGTSALAANLNGRENTAIGSNSLVSNTEGNQNTAIGYKSLEANTNGSFNTANGEFSLASITSGSYNTAIGFNAGSTAAGNIPNTISNSSVYLGIDTKASVDGAQNEIVIGYNAIGGGSNTMQLGNGITNVKTDGTLTAGAVTYPNLHGTSGQVFDYIRFRSPILGISRSSLHRGFWSCGFRRL